MEFETFNFRNALAILDQRPEWAELKEAIHGITREEIVEAHLGLVARRKKPPAGAQQALNLVFRNRLPKSQWVHECRLFEATDPSSKRELAKWTMDFVKRGPAAPGSQESDFGFGVEVTFNHAEAIAWTLVRLDLASESGIRVRDDARIDVGVAVYASKALKAWGQMDSAVGTYERACLWLGLMKPVLPIPLVLVGLKPRDVGTLDTWQAPRVFRGTTKS